MEERGSKSEFQGEVKMQQTVNDVMWSDLTDGVRVTMFELLSNHFPGDDAWQALSLTPNNIFQLQKLLVAEKSWEAELDREILELNERQLRYIMSGNPITEEAFRDSFGDTLEMEISTLLGFSLTRADVDKGVAYLDKLCLYSEAPFDKWLMDCIGTKISLDHQLPWVDMSNHKQDLVKHQESEVPDHRDPSITKNCLPKRQSAKRKRNHSLSGLPSCQPFLEDQDQPPRQSLLIKLQLGYERMRSLMIDMRRSPRMFTFDLNTGDSRESVDNTEQSGGEQISSRSPSYDDRRLIFHDFEITNLNTEQEQPTSNSKLATAFKQTNAPRKIVLKTNKNVSIPKEASETSMSVPWQNGDFMMTPTPSDQGQQITTRTKRDTPKDLGKGKLLLEITQPAVFPQLETGGCEEIAEEIVEKKRRRRQQQRDVQGIKSLVSPSERESSETRDSPESFLEPSLRNHLNPLALNISDMKLPDKRKEREEYLSSSELSELQTDALMSSSGDEKEEDGSKKETSFQSRYSTRSTQDGPNLSTPITRPGQIKFRPFNSTNIGHSGSASNSVPARHAETSELSLSTPGGHVKGTDSTTKPSNQPTNQVPPVDSDDLPIPVSNVASSNTRGTRSSIRGGRHRKKLSVDDAAYDPMKQEIDEQPSQSKNSKTRAPKTTIRRNSRVSIKSRQGETSTATLSSCTREKVKEIKEKSGRKRKEPSS